MKRNTILKLLLVAFTGILLSGCSSTVYFGHWPSGIHRVPAKKGETAKELVANQSMVMGLVYSSRGRWLYSAQQGTINAWGTDGSYKGLLIRPGTANCVGLDEKAGRIYWGDHGRRHIAGSNLAGGDFRVYADYVNHPNAVAVNPKLGYLYWVQSTPCRGVWMSRLDGSGKHMIAIERALPTGLAVDVKSGRVFWSHGTQLDGSARIISSNFDGGYRNVLLHDRNAHIDDLALNPANGRLVWSERRTDGQPAGIRSVKLDGSEAKTICNFTGDQFAQSVTVGPPRKR